MDPVDPTPSRSIHVARAYGVTPPQLRIEPMRSISAPDRNDAYEPSVSQGVSRLLAGVVPGGVDFSTNQPTPKGPALPMYRHPADRNAAGTALWAGRMIDLSA